MNLAAIFVFVVVVVGVLFLLRSISNHRKSQAAVQFTRMCDKQLVRLENIAVDVATMIGDVDFEQVSMFTPGEYDIWFSIFIRRNNKHERFSLYINMDGLLPLDDYELDKEMTKEVRKKSAEVLNKFINVSKERTYR